MTAQTPAAASIREATRRQLPALSRLAASAFAPMDLWRWIIPDDQVRPGLLAATVRRELNDVHARDGMVLVAEVTGAPAALALWRAPGQAITPRWRSLPAAPAMLRAGTRESLRILGQRGPRVDAALHRVHPAEPHWYLELLTVDPRVQTTGLGSALVRAGLRLSDPDHLPSYLECERHLIPYDQRFGFTVSQEMDLGPGAPDHVGMWRPATPPQLARPGSPLDSAT